MVKTAVLFAALCLVSGLAATTKNVTLNILDGTTVNVTGLPMNASLYDVMVKAETDDMLK